MAYVEVWKSGRLLTRRRVDEQKAKSGCRVRLGSAGEVRAVLGQPVTLGDFEVRIFEGEPPEARQQDQRTASIMPGDAPVDSTARAGQISEFPDIEGYKIIEPLGEGGMGIVWRAEQLSTRREIALKLLISQRVDSVKAQVRFQREVQLTARLDHPNIARIYDSGLHQGMYYYAMELIEGLPLDQYVKTQTFSKMQILALMQKICQAVLYAHLHAVIHRDLKPSNIIISPDGQPHILDFGLAKALLDDEEEEEELTISVEGQIAGTPAYMSPEQASGYHNQLDTRTDVYSLGVILFELLTGQSPHDLSFSMFDLLRQIASGNIRRPSEVDKSIDNELEAILLKALAHNPEQRYASAGALAKDITNYLDEEPLDARVPTTLYFLRKRALKYKKQVGIAAAVLVIIFVTVIAAYTRIIGERGRRRAAEQDVQIQARQAELAGKKAEWAELELKVLGRNTEEARAALRVLREEYDKAQQNINELQQKIDQGITPVPTKRINLRKGEPLFPTAIIRKPALPDGVKSWTLETSGQRGVIHKVAYSPDGRFLVICSRGMLSLWDTHQWQPLYQRQIFDVSYQEHIEISWSPDSSSLAIGSRDLSTIVVLDVETGNALCTLSENQKTTSSLAFSPDGSRLATGHPDGSLQIWDTGTKPYNLLRPINAHTDRLSGLVWLLVEDRILSSGFDNTIKLWNSENGRLIRTYNGQEAPVITRTALSTDGIYFLSGSRDGTFRLWDSRSDGPGRILIDNLDIRQTKYHTVTLSPDGETMAYGSSDGYIHLWNFQTEEQIRSFATCCADIHSLEFSHDGRILICGGMNGIVQVFNIDKNYEPYVVLVPLLDFGVPGFSVNPQGDYRGPKGIEDYIEYIVQTANGREKLTPKVFANKYGWVNEPWQVGLFQPGLEEIDRIYVKADAQRPFDGKGWETAFNDLQDALNVARPGTEIWVAAGVYKPDRGTGAREASFQLRNGISLYGGFAGSEINRYERDPNMNQTILSGDLKGDDGPEFTNNEENCYNVITVSGVDETTIIDGFIITGGNADGRSGAFNFSHGGGMYNRGSNMTIINCTFRENCAIEGGGMYHDHGEPKIIQCIIAQNKADYGGGISARHLKKGIMENCTFLNNSADKDGGGFYNYLSNLTLANCMFIKNNTNQDGGGLWNSGKSVLINCTFSENYALGGGAGVFCRNEFSFTLTNCTLVSNSSESSGGGISLRGPGSTLLSGCRFIKNSAVDAAGMIIQGQVDPKPTLINCAFIGNTAGDTCGGLAIDNSDPWLMNCVFAGNKGNRFSGAVNIKSGNPILTNCTIVGNTVNGHGSGINNGGDMCNMKLTNCIIWGNIHNEDDLEAAQIRGGGMSVNHCCIQGWSGKLGGFGNIGADPMFIDPNGPDGIIGTEDDNLYLSPYSPCLNVGDNTSLPADMGDLDSDGDTNEPIPFDIEGKSRIIDNIVDIGAYEAD